MFPGAVSAAGPRTTVQDHSTVLSPDEAAMDWSGRTCSLPPAPTSPEEAPKACPLPRHREIRGEGHAVVAGMLTGRLQLKGIGGLGHQRLRRALGCQRWHPDGQSRHEGGSSVVAAGVHTAVPVPAAGHGGPPRLALQRGLATVSGHTGARPGSLSLPRILRPAIVLFQLLN